MVLSFDGEFYVANNEIGWLRAFKVYGIPQESRFFGLRRKEGLELAYQFAYKNVFQYTFNNENNSVGKDQLRELKEEILTFPYASQRPEATSAARVQAFNRSQVVQFFTLLEDVIYKRLNLIFLQYNIFKKYLHRRQKAGW